MYTGFGRLSIINTEGQMRIFLMTPVGVVVTTRGRERVKTFMYIIMIYYLVIRIKVLISFL